jgi:hypothetical protein
VGEGGGSLVFGFSKKTHRAKSDPYFKICILNQGHLNQKATRSFLIQTALVKPESITPPSRVDIL